MSEQVRTASGAAAAQTSDAQPLSAAEMAQLVEFARACKAAARAVGLYPGGHPSIAATLGRIVQLTSAEKLRAPLRISVLADTLFLHGRAPTRWDAALGEMAALLHGHLIGELIVYPGGDVEGWRRFLLLLGRAPEAIRAEGGISRLWATTAGGHVEVREIDYAEVLRERGGGADAAWEQVIANCLQGDAVVLDEAAVQALLDLAGDSAKLEEMLATVDQRAVEEGRGLSGRTTALLRLIQGLVHAVTQKDPGRLDPVLRKIATAVGRLSPDMMVSLLSSGAEPDARGGSGDAANVVDAVVSRMSDRTISGFVARHALAENTSIERLAQAFQTLVRDSGQRERLLTLAHDEAADSPFGALESFEEQWDQVAQKMLTSYSDRPFVSDAYARELSGARTRAIDVEHTSDDPPERLNAWKATVATSELRELDLTLMLDLLRIEDAPERWSMLMRPLVTLLEDLFLVGDFEGAERLLQALLSHTTPEASQHRRQTALIAIDVLVKGSMMRHIVGHLIGMDQAQFDRVKALCVSLGEVLIRPLAEVLSTESRARPRERLTAILLAFGAIGRREVERLKGSPNAAVRRTAIHLLREFGGSEALPELTELLDDREQHVQREAVRAILNIGTEKAYQVLRQALASGSEKTRDVIMQSLLLVRDERAAPLFSYILRHVDHRGALNSIYLRAIDALGALKDPAGVSALAGALQRGEWWAPRRTATLRRAAAAALARVGTPEALDVLEEASHHGPRGVRLAVRQAQAARRAPGERRGAS
jgi:hypothetical protein